MGSLHLLSSAPTTNSPPPPFCLLIFQRMQASSCRPPRAFPFHSPAGYGALPIPRQSPPPPPLPPPPPPPAPPLPPQLLPSGCYVSTTTTIAIATSQPLGREELFSPCERWRGRGGAGGGGGGGGGRKVNETCGCLTPALSEE